MFLWKYELIGNICKRPRILEKSQFGDRANFVSKLALQKASQPVSKQASKPVSQLLSCTVVFLVIIWTLFLTVNIYPMFRSFLSFFPWRYNSLIWTPVSWFGVNWKRVWLPWLYQSFTLAYRKYFPVHNLVCLIMWVLSLTPQSVSRSVTFSYRSPSVKQDWFKLYLN